MAQEQGKDEAAIKKFFQTSPTSLLQRFIAPEEVAEMIALVCSPISSDAEGASLRVVVVRSVM